MRRILPLLWAVYARAQSGIEVPAIGAIVDPWGNLREVHGVAGNFLLGAASVPGVVAAACGERLCLAKTDSKIVSATGETDAPTGQAIFDVNDAEAVVFFPETRTFARWHDDSLDPLDWTVDGEVVSIRASEIAVRRGGQIWIVHPDGSVVDWIAAAAGPVLLLADGVLFAAPDELVLRHRDGTEVHFDLPAAESITAMGARYAAIRTGNATYALRTGQGREHLYLLPATSP